MSLVNGLMEQRVLTVWKTVLLVPTEQPVTLATVLILKYPMYVRVLVWGQRTTIKPMFSQECANHVTRATGSLYLLRTTGVSVVQNTVHYVVISLSVSSVRREELGILVRTSVPYAIFRLILYSRTLVSLVDLGLSRIMEHSATHVLATVFLAQTVQPARFVI